MKSFDIKTTRSTVGETRSRQPSAEDTSSTAEELSALAKVKVGGEAGSQRFRSSSIRFEMDGKTLEIFDISASGICLRDLPTWIEEGQALSFALLLVSEEGIRRISLSGMVHHRDGADVVVTYPAPFENWEKFLREFIARNM
ncbi:hypothetical protein HH303_17920 [Rhodospirillaceae bacterium KN72]|uniref:PilZ domain-containing protein n=1 Tax=Pacificispira spongiicola TaxID=2729598 RepID=A0A7Y0HIB7_9PROT|nr:hypothetical protein [Pacificispira spongiicola]NMM46374.1 hypothetical protein [Pacificispira spongiicola]